MKIFIIGYSGIGKSPLTNKLLKKISNVQIISASGWVRSVFPSNTHVDVLTAYSKHKLRSDPNSCVDYINRHYSFDNQISIIEGIRNPYDFNRLFDYTKDMVIILSRNGLHPKTSFEECGVSAIVSYIDFLLSQNFLSFDRILKVHFNSPNKYSTDATTGDKKIYYNSSELNTMIFHDLEDAIEPLENIISDIAHRVTE